MTNMIPFPPELQKVHEESDRATLMDRIVIPKDVPCGPMTFANFGGYKDANDKLHFTSTAHVGYPEGTTPGLVDVTFANIQKSDGSFELTYELGNFRTANELSVDPGDTGYQCHPFSNLRVTRLTRSDKNVGAAYKFAATAEHDYALSQPARLSGVRLQEDPIPVQLVGEMTHRADACHMAIVTNKYGPMAYLARTEQELADHVLLRHHSQLNVVPKRGIGWKEALQAMLPRVELEFLEITPEPVSGHLPSCRCPSCWFAGANADASCKFPIAQSVSSAATAEAPLAIEIVMADDGRMAVVYDLHDELAMIRAEDLAQKLGGGHLTSAISRCYDMAAGQTGKIAVLQHGDGPYEAFGPLPGWELDQHLYQRLYQIDDSVKHAGSVEEMMEIARQIPDLEVHVLGALPAPALDVNHTKTPDFAGL